MRGVSTVHPHLRQPRRMASGRGSGCPPRLEFVATLCLLVAVGAADNTTVTTQTTTEAEGTDTPSARDAGSSGGSKGIGLQDPNYIDECEQCVEPPCAKEHCDAAERVCVDDYPLAGSFGDWHCVKVDNPSSGLRIEMRHQIEDAVKFIEVEAFTRSTAVYVGVLGFVRDLACNLKDTEAAFGDPLDFEHHPFGMGIGSGNQRYLIGTCLLNPIIPLFFMLVLLAIERILDYHGYSLEVVRDTVRAPGVVIIPMLFILPGWTLAASRLILFPHVTRFYSIMGLICLGAIIAFPVILYKVVICNIEERTVLMDDPYLADPEPEGGEGGAHEDVDDTASASVKGPEEKAPDHRAIASRRLQGWQRVLYRAVYGDRMWMTKDHSFFCERYGMVFEALKPGTHNLIVGQICAVIFLGLMSAVQPRDMTMCNVRNSLMTVVTFGVLLGLIWYRPYLGVVDNAMAIIMWSIVTACMVILTVEIAMKLNKRTPLLGMASALLILAAILLFVKALWDVTAIIIARFVIRRKETARKIFNRDYDDPFRTTGFAGGEAVRFPHNASVEKRKAKKERDSRPARGGAGGSGLASSGLLQDEAPAHRLESDVLNERSSPGHRASGASADPLASHRDVERRQLRRLRRTDNNDVEALFLSSDSDWDSDSGSEGGASAAYKKSPRMSMSPALGNQSSGGMASGAFSKSFHLQTFNKSAFPGLGLGDGVGGGDAVGFRGSIRRSPGGGLHPQPQRGSGSFSKSFYTPLSKAAVPLAVGDLSTHRGRPGSTSAFASQRGGGLRGGSSYGSPGGSVDGGRAGSARFSPLSVAAGSPLAAAGAGGGGIMNLNMNPLTQHGGDGSARSSMRSGPSISALRAAEARETRLYSDLYAASVVQGSGRPNFHQKDGWGTAWGSSTGSQSLLMASSGSPSASQSRQSLRSNPRGSLRPGELGPARKSFGGGVPLTVAVTPPQPRQSWSAPAASSARSLSPSPGPASPPRTTPSPPKKRPAAHARMPVPELQIEMPLSPLEG